MATRAEQAYVLTAVIGAVAVNVVPREGNVAIGLPSSRPAALDTLLAVRGVPPAFDVLGDAPVAMVGQVVVRREPTFDQPLFGIDEMAGAGAVTAVALWNRVSAHLAR